ncbi:MAG: methionyl-tRNA formyltransferase [Gaiellaceae bacterium]
MKVVLVAQIPPAVQGLTELLRALGHDPVALLCTRAHAGRYGDAFDALVRDAPDGLDIVIPASRAGIAPLLRRYEPDVLLCAGFPWKIPPDALAVPTLGAVNGHPSFLPRHRGPSPVAWAIRNGETEVGFTFHRMDAELDTGTILAQGTAPFDDEHSWEELTPKLADLVSQLFPMALARVERGDPGDPQEGEASYEGFFEPGYAWIDWTQPSPEIYRQVRSWRFASASTEPRGALTELDGSSVRVLRLSLEPAEGRPMECGGGTVWILETEPA